MSFALARRRQNDRGTGEIPGHFNVDLAAKSSNGRLLVLDVFVVEVAFLSCLLVLIFETCDGDVEPVL